MTEFFFFIVTFVLSGKSKRYSLLSGRKIKLVPSNCDLSLAYLLMKFMYSYLNNMISIQYSKHCAHHLHATKMIIITENLLHFCRGNTEHHNCINQKQTLFKVVASSKSEVELKYLKNQRSCITNGSLISCEWKVKKQYKYLMLVVRICHFTGSQPLFGLHNYTKYFS